MSEVAEKQKKSPVLAMTQSLLARLGCSPAAQELCERVLLEEEAGSVCLRLSSAEQDVLRESPAVRSGLFVLQRGLFYTRRNWGWEQAVEHFVQERNRIQPDSSLAVPPEIFGKPGEELQRQAVEMLCSRSFSILTGGPGTGKTYTIAQAVKLWQKEHPGLRLKIAAPTGKAAARVREAMAAALENAGSSEKQSLEASTIHRLLRPNHDLVTFKHHHENPLPLDWLIVDEASMIDLSLMAKLLDALPKECRLTLVGDEHQLASVEAGRVFGDLCRMDGVPKTCLKISRRFREGSEIARLAEAVNDGDASGAMALLGDSAKAQVHYTVLSSSVHTPGRWPGFRELLEEQFRAFRDAVSPSEALAALGGCRVLCPFRKGYYGTEALNAYLRELLGEECPLPIMITQNDQSLKVSNGDLGVVMPNRPGICHLSGDVPGAVREIPMELLPGWECAFASTVHKSQGSEFRNVVIVLPPEYDGLPEAENLLTREILYTAITRTRAEIFLFAGDNTIRHCCTHRIQRRSGLVDQ